MNQLRDYEEHEIFDYYDNILQLKKDEAVQKGFPIAR